MFEQCDDGNLENGDGCNSGCQWEFCGDGTAQPGAPIRLADPESGEILPPENVELTEECDGEGVDDAGVSCVACRRVLPCDECRRARCGGWLEFEGVSFDNDCGGNCEAAADAMAQCFEATECYIYDLDSPDDLELISMTPCLCGDLDAITCTSGATPNVCEDQIMVAFGVDSIINVLFDWDLPTRAGHRVIKYYDCIRGAEGCAEECNYPTWEE